MTFLPGTNDLTMARNGILQVLPAGDMIIADKAYKGASTQIITPIEEENSNFNRHHKLIMAMHEHINNRVKDFKSRSDTWRHGLEAHIPTFYAVIALTQIKLENGEPMPDPYIIET